MQFCWRQDFLSFGKMSFCLLGVRIRRVKAIDPGPPHDEKGRNQWLLLLEFLPEIASLRTALWLPKYTPTSYQCSASFKPHRFYWPIKDAKTIDYIIYICLVPTDVSIVSSHFHCPPSRATIQSNPSNNLNSCAKVWLDIRQQQLISKYPE